MKAQRGADGGVSAATAQPMSAHALPGGVAGERLANGARSARIAIMKTPAETDGMAAKTVQPCSSAFVSHAAAPIRLIEQLHKAEGATLNSMTVTKDQAIATPSSTAGTRSQYGCKVRAVAEHRLLLAHQTICHINKTEPKHEMKAEAIVHYRHSNKEARI